MFFRRHLTFYFLFPTVFLFSCQKENSFDCLKSTGKIKTEIRQIASFRTLRVFDNLDVKIVADTASFLEVKAGDNLQENILSELKNGELWLQNINKCNWVRSYHKPLEITVHTTKISDIFHEGDGTISSEGILPADTLFLHLNSAGDYNLHLNTRTVWLDMYELGNMKLRGKNQILNAYINSLGSLQASELQNQEAYLSLNSLGNAFVEAAQLITAGIEGKGNVYYQNPPVKTHRSGNGSGQLVQVK